MNERPDDSIRELARKTAKSIVDHGSIPMATLKESIKLQDKVDELLAKEIEFPEQEPFPEIPEFPSEIAVTNLPEVQKVEVLNFPETQAPVVNISPQVVNVEAPVVNVNQEEVVDELVKIAALLSKDEAKEEASGQTQITDQKGSIIDFKDLFKKLGEQIGSIRPGGSSVSKYLLNQLGVVINPATVEGQADIVSAIENITITGGATEANQTNGLQKVQIVDAGGDAVTVTGGKLDTNAAAGAATEATLSQIESTAFWLKSLIRLLKPLSIVTGGGVNRLSVDVNGVTSVATVAAVTTVTTVTTTTTVGTLSNQTNVGNVSAFTMQQGLLRNAYANGVRRNLTF